MNPIPNYQTNPGSNNTISINELTFRSLVELGHDPKHIRLAMLDLINLTSKKIATRLEVSRSAITQVIRGDRKTSHLQERIAQVYNVPVQVLFPDHGHGVCKSCPLAN